MKKKSLFFIVLFLGSFASAQKYNNDVSSVDKIIAALYEAISGEAGSPRDWERFQNLFGKEAKLIPTSKNPQGDLQYRTMTPAEYITMFTSRISTGFFERELHKEVNEYGSIVHSFSTYVTSLTANSTATNRGINSIQLFKDKDRYYIVNIFWCAESMGFPLPEKYLSKN